MMTISDTGTGMEPHVLARAFEPFFTTKEAGKGSGLGLSMVFGFAKQSNGHVKIHSQPGEGTTIKMYLPRAAQADKETTSSPSRSKLPRGSETILLVDDNELVRTYAATQLASLGYKLVPASNGQEALDTLREITDIDLLFTDIVMPGRLSGLNLAEEARTIRPNLPILFTSGYAENAQGDLGFGIHFLRKPYRPSELAVKVRLMLDGNA
ncbi:response regulator [Sinorhizobium sp. BJ1]|uniref:response regulator n=1 Tax=Sinorhizobium sp. BJ1 TaxID=2035455 RepID=UPI000BE8403B|nr:hypothetical protein CO676_27095 [Sinorhizobium sp. BJ1]